MELNDQYCSPNNVLVMKSRRMSWLGQVYGGEEMCIQGFCGET